MQLRSDGKERCVTWKPKKKILVLNTCSEKNRQQLFKMKEVPGRAGELRIKHKKTCMYVAHTDDASKLNVDLRPKDKNPGANEWRQNFKKDKLRC